jgi:hypothetical protein
MEYLSLNGLDSLEGKFNTAYLMTWTKHQFANSCLESNFKELIGDLCGKIFRSSIFAIVKIRLNLICPFEEEEKISLCHELYESRE